MDAWMDGWLNGWKGEQIEGETEEVPTFRGTFVEHWVSQSINKLLKQPVNKVTNRHLDVRVTARHSQGPPIPDSLIIIGIRTFNPSVSIFSNPNTQPIALHENGK